MPRETKTRPPDLSKAAGQTSRRSELADRIADIVLEKGLGELGLRGLAEQLGTSDRMLIYYFGTKDQLITESLDRVSERLSVALQAAGAGARVPAGEFLSRVLAQAANRDMAPFMRLWTDVIARGARGETPYDKIGAKVVRSWIAWIGGRLTPADDDPDQARPAALLAILEGITLLELAAPGCTARARLYISRKLDAVGTRKPKSLTKRQ